MVFEHFKYGIEVKYLLYTLYHPVLIYLQRLSSVLMYFKALKFKLAICYLIYSHYIATG